MKSTSKSSSIRDIENKYNINLTTCTHAQLDSLTSKSSKHKVISKLKDLMINTRQFDLKNMTEAERANLKYLVMSTDEILEVLKKHTKSIYYKPRYKRLRWLMSYDEFYQTCAHKLLLNDGILKFNANYKLECALHFWFDRVAGWKCIRKANIADEITILDKPCGDDSDTTIGELMLKGNEDEYSPECFSIDVNRRINLLLESMDKTPHNKIVLRAGNTEIPFSEYALAKLFIVHQLSKKELAKIVINSSTQKPVSNQIFNKFYKQTLMHISELLNKEANECGEYFSINENDL